VKQLGFFGDDPVEPVVEADAAALAARLPRGLRFGTCSWSFAGWAGVVWRGRPSESTLARHGLGAYARFPLFGAAEIDRGFYRPLEEHDFARYAAQLPPRYPVASKLWSELTTHTFPNHPRLGDRAGARNPRFLDAALAREVLAPYAAAFAEHTGPLMFQFPPVPGIEHRDPIAFARLIDRLLGAVPPGPYAFELRNRELLTPRYLDALRAHGAAHVLNFWQSMPTVGAQLDAGAADTAPFVIARLVQPPGTSFEERRAACEPFDRIVDAQPAMRADVARVVRRAVESGRDVYVLVDNKAEGSAPRTIRALAEEIARG
jgi:uncharacterized protein YecE (DUF72 family)